MLVRTRQTKLNAIQWNKHGDHPSVTRIPEDNLLRNPLYFGYLQRYSSIGLIVSPGDWIVEYEDGSYHRFREDEFHKTFEICTE